jgi:hypothetical protein
MEGGLLYNGWIKDVQCKDIGMYNGLNVDVQWSDARLEKILKI